MGIISTERYDINNTVQSSYNVPLTTPSGTKRLLLGVYRPYTNDLTGTLSAVTWNGTGMTVVGASTENQWATAGIAVLTDPAIGSYNAVVTLTSDFGRLSVVAVYLDDYGTVDNFASSLFTNSVAVTSATGRTVIAFAGNSNAASGSVAPGTGETEVAEYAGVNLNVRQAVLTEDGASSVTINPTIDGTGDNFVYAVSVEFAASGETFYLKNSVAGSSNHGSLQDGGTAPTTATTTTGWDFTALDVGQYALMDFGVERVAGDFSGTEPSAGPNNTLGDCFRSENAYTGQFAAGTWVLTVPMVADGGAGGDLRIQAKLWRSANQDGSSATQITSDWVDGTTVTNLQTGTPQSSVVTISGLSAVTMSNEYLFVQILCAVQ